MPLKFDGTAGGAGINANSAAVLNNLGPITISSWVNISGFGGFNFGSIVDKSTNSAAISGFWEFGIGDGTNKYFYFKKSFAVTNLNRQTSNTSWSFNTAYHVLLTWDGTATAANSHIYQNGVEPSYSATTDGVGIVETDTLLPLVIGNRKDGLLTFQGIISELAIWNVVLTQNEITQLYKANVRGMPLQVQPSALVGYWPLDDYPEKFTIASTTNMQDRSKNANTGIPALSSGTLVSSAEQVLSYQP